MLTLRVRFLYGRYHAKKWGANVNDGEIDWPPSPWRIMRAIIHTWRTYHPATVDDVVWPVLQQLIRHPPKFYLPRASKSHVRHYVPLVNKDSKALMLNPFVVIEREARLTVVWDSVTISTEQLDTLNNIVSDMKYLGRAESLCEVTADASNSEQEPNCVPLSATNNTAHQDAEVIEVLVPDAKATIQDLSVRTRDLEKNQMFPKKSHNILYARHKTPNSSDHTLVSRTRPSNGINVVRFMIGGRIRPLLTRSVRVSESFRKAAISQYGTISNGRKTAALSGHEKDGASVEGHTHAFYIPTDDDNDGRIDHLTVFKHGAFSPEEITALESVNYVWDGGERMQVVFSGHGDSANFDTSFLKRSKKWKTITPYVGNRFDRKNLSAGENAVRHIRAEVRKRNMPEPVAICPIPGGVVGKFRAHKYCRRTDARSHLSRNAFMVTILFENVLQGPLCLGHGAHFGLGLFVPTEDEVPGE